MARGRQTYNRFLAHHLPCKLRAQLGHTRGAAKSPAVAWTERATMRKIVQSIGKVSRSSRRWNRGSSRRHKWSGSNTWKGYDTMPSWRSCCSIPGKSEKALLQIKGSLAKSISYIFVYIIHVCAYALCLIVFYP